MIIDKLLSPAILLPLSGFTVSTQVIGSVMDFSVARNNGLLAIPYGPGFDINVRDADSANDTATLNLQLVTDDDAALGSPTILWSSGVKSVADLVKFDEFVELTNTDSWARYVGWRAVVGTQVFTAGTLSIEFAANKRMWRAYPAQGNQ